MMPCSSLYVNIVKNNKLLKQLWTIQLNMLRINESINQTPLQQMYVSVYIKIISPAYVAQFSWH